jgi:AraC-like DNA-binding protein
MTSVARPHWDFVFWETAEGISAGIQGPESCSSEAPVPVGAEFIGVRAALGVFPTDVSVSSLVDRFVPLRVTGGAVHFRGERFRLPDFDQAEGFVEGLVRTGLLSVADLTDRAVSGRTRQRRHLAAVGLSQRTVRQIERAHDAAVRIQAGDAAAVVAQELGYFDQPHLARSLRRFIGPSSTELSAGPRESAPMSLLYKTSRRLDG